MEKYTVPTMEIKDFEEENVVVTNSVVTPADGDTYKSGSTGVNIEETKYIVKWAF